VAVSPRPIVASPACGRGVLLLMAVVNANKVVVLTGETGCGKTTQVPQFLLEEAEEKGYGAHCRIMVTQPRRIAAIRCGLDSCVSSE
jgi:type II secretory pathway predicted ATPase ExeA